ncbi:hypothetical protein SDC9_98371 [bioreactor metagenome]|uniref:Uncharacterized protein n=1 Tax=bioreactor metagenome TaxID=1076179 RepID=A0A645AH58_9ZZZZ
MDVLDDGDRADTSHYLFGAVVHIDLDGLAAAGYLYKAGGDAAFLDVALMGLDHHRRAVADEGAGDRDDLPRLVGGEIKERGDAVRV